eukprot:390399-Rhodomonas_salina.2
MKQIFIYQSQVQTLTGSLPVSPSHCCPESSGPDSPLVGLGLGFCVPPGSCFPSGWASSSQAPLLPCLTQPEARTRDHAGTTTTSSTRYATQ